MSAFRRYLYRGLLLLAMAGSLFVPATSAYAATNPYDGINCSGAAAASVVCHKSTGNPISGTNGIIHRTTRLIAMVAGSVAVIIIVLAGIRYITSNGDAEAVGKAKRTIIFAAIGLMIIIAGQAIISLVINKVI